MFRLIAVTDSDKHFSSAIQEYEKRLWKDFQFVAIKPFKDKNPQLCIQKDTDAVFEYISKKTPSDTVKVMCSIDGKALSTSDFVKLTSHRSVVFIVWGPYGLDEPQLKWIIDRKISFGHMTMPHGLVKLVLLEQLYRAETIRTGKKYHY